MNPQQPKCEDQKCTPCQATPCKSTPCKSVSCPAAPCNASPCRQAPSSKPNQCAKSCTKSTNPVIDVNPCQRTKCNNESFCTRVNKDGCDVYELTAYGKEFIAGSGKILVNCTCMKFNGLQDSCQNSGCCNKSDCLNIPFPTCPPAQKWKNDFICCKNPKKSKDC